MLTNTQLIGIILVAGIAFLFFIWRRPHTKPDNGAQQNLFVEDITTADSPKSMPDTSIKRFAKVDGDDYQMYYQPILATAAKYLKLVGHENDLSQVHTVCTKALRKRWSVIFHAQNEKNHAEEATFWTYSIFCCVIVRFLVRELNQYQFEYQKTILSPYLYPLDDLSKAENTLRARTNKPTYPANTINIHIIDKVLPPHIIDLLSQKQSYPYLVNAVTGFYQNKHHPYYTIIEQVEAHVLNIKHNNWFESALSRVLKLIENNTLTKNTIQARVFESLYSLLIDRHLLWEMFKVYQVSDQPALSKAEFERTLKDTLSLKGDADQYNYEIKIASSQEETISFTTTNMIALPYSKIEYKYGRRIIAKKIINERDIIPMHEFIDELEYSLSDSAGVEPIKDDLTLPEESSSVGVSVEDLFKKEKNN